MHLNLKQCCFFPSDPVMVDTDAAQREEDKVGYVFFFCKLSRQIHGNNNNNNNYNKCVIITPNPGHFFPLIHFVWSIRQHPFNLKKKPWRRELRCPLVLLFLPKVNNFRKHSRFLQSWSIRRVLMTCLGLKIQRLGLWTWLGTWEQRLETCDVQNNNFVSPLPFTNLNVKTPIKVILSKDSINGVKSSCQCVQ